MSGFKRLWMPFGVPRKVLLISGIVFPLIGASLGIADNPPGILFVLAGISCLLGALVWNWRSPRSFWVLGGISVLSFLMGSILHNLLYALGMMLESPLLLPVVRGLGTISFLTAVMVSPPAVLVSLIGGIAVSWAGLPGLVRKNRSYRRFYQEIPLSEKKLRQLINLARLSASAANRQVLKFVISTDRQKNQHIFSTLGWAGYLKDWLGPEQGERPSAYILILGEPELGPLSEYDAGIVAENILLGAVERGLGGCILASIRRDALRSSLGIPERYQIMLVIALGVPREKVVIDPLGADGSIQYWRDDHGVHHVPKRPLDEVLLDF